MRAALSQSPVVALSDSAWTVLRRRYLRRDASGEVVETPEAMFGRVAKTVAAADGAYGATPNEVLETCERFYRRMATLEFLPNSPTLMNAGRVGGQLAACFVVPVGDSMTEIFDAVKWAAEIQMTGGGTGFSFSRLRPEGDRVASTGGAASGPLSFMDVFNAATDAVKQGGARRGANMGVLRIDHPDILKFIAAKRTPGRLDNFNISVALTDEFMAALETGGPYRLINPRTGEASGTLDAQTVFRSLSEAAWATGDPGVLFLDRINAAHPLPGAGPIEATNPCAEQPLLPFESCVLGSINLAKFAIPAGAEGNDGSRATIDWARLGEAVDDGVHFLDNVIDVNHYPLPQIAAVTRAHRKIGLGVMGLADLFIELLLPYDSDEALACAEEIAVFIEQRSLQASAALAARRGAFLQFGNSTWAAEGHAPLRNATTTTVAPTGTISIIANTSSGIEPLFALSLVRRVLDGEQLLEVHPLFLSCAKRRGLWSEGLRQELAARGGVRGQGLVPSDLERLFATAHDIAPEAHLAMQATFQRRSHSAVSKTVNLPAAATPEDIERIYRRAYQLGCKGVTVYRDGSHAGQVLSFGEANLCGGRECAV